MTSLKWYEFNDNHAGAIGKKTKYEKIFVQAKNESQAINRFKRKFKINPFASSCDCCGSAFSLYSEDLPEYESRDAYYLPVRKETRVFGLTQEERDYKKSQEKETKERVQQERVQQEKSQYYQYSDKVYQLYITDKLDKIYQVIVYQNKLTFLGYFKEYCKERYISDIYYQVCEIILISELKQEKNRRNNRRYR